MANTLAVSPQVYWRSGETLQYTCKSQWTFKNSESTSIECEENGDEGRWSDYDNIICIPGEHTTYNLGLTIAFI